MYAPQFSSITRVGDELSSRAEIVETCDYEEERCLRISMALHDQCDDVKVKAEALVALADQNNSEQHRRGHVLKPEKIS